MGCQRSQCSGCNQPYKACQLINGLCQGCRARQEPQQGPTELPLQIVQKPVIDEQIITEIKQSNNEYYS